MPSWKQIVLALVIVVAAAAAWARFYPGAPQLLARWGMDWAIAATPPPPQTTAAGGGKAGGSRAGQIVKTGPKALCVDLLSIIYEDQSTNFGHSPMRYPGRMRDSRNILVITIDNQSKRC